MSTAPLPFTWTGSSFEPLPRFAKQCDAAFVIGERYMLVEVEERSGVSHRHEFAWLKEAWLQLPDDLAALYPSPEHLRKRALIDAGFFDEEIIDAGTNAAAIRVASSFRHREEFSLVIVRGPLVCVRTAKSQSRRAMDGKQFQESKTALMEVVAALINVTPAELTHNTGRAA